MLDAFVLSDVIEQSPGFLTQPSPSGLSRGGGEFRSFVRHDDDIASLVLHHPGEVDVGLMGSFVEELLLKNGNDMLRYKGILAVRGEARRLVFQGVHRITGFDYGRDWAIMFGGHHMAYNIAFTGGVGYPTPNHLGVEPKASFTQDGQSYAPLVFDDQQFIRPLIPGDCALDQLEVTVARRWFGKGRNGHG